mmetsp:Transcript_7453/g.6718  ORF Transcript_7453/g.6718 Transcript_7453/m.6718 type:complete len:117 (-) Transcript_7453:1224-1574(-)
MGVHKFEKTTPINFKGESGLDINMRNENKNSQPTGNTVLLHNFYSNQTNMDVVEGSKGSLNDNTNFSYPTMTLGPCPDYQSQQVQPKKDLNKTTKLERGSSLSSQNSSKLNQSDVQ